MNPLDLILGVILVGSFVRALLRGFFAEAFALGGVIMGLLLAAWFHTPVAQRLHPLIQSWIRSPHLADLAAFLLILAATMVTAALLARLLRKTASAVGLGFADRLLGGLFGLLRGGILGFLLLLALTTFLPNESWVKTSYLAPYFLRAAHAVSFIMPSDLTRSLPEGINHLKHSAPRWIN